MIQITDNAKKDDNKALLASTFHTAQSNTQPGPFINKFSTYNSNYRYCYQALHASKFHTAELNTQPSPFVS
jgi:hypothetical protein